MHSELSYGLSFAPKLQRVAVMSLSGSHQPTPDPSFSLKYYYYYYKLAAPRKDFFWASICHANTDPPVMKIRLWAPSGV